MISAKDFRALRVQAGLSHSETALLLRQEEKHIVLCDTDDGQASKIGHNALALLERFALSNPVPTQASARLARSDLVQSPINGTRQTSERQLGGRYKSASAAKAHGRTYTPDELAQFVAGQIVQYADVRPGERYTLLDPAIGDGALVIALLDELHRHSVTSVDVTAFDTDADAMAVAADRIKAAHPDARLDLRHQDFLDYAKRAGVDRRSLFHQAAPSFDLIVANPPYVRTQALESEHARSLAAAFGLTGRTDLLHVFLLALLRMVAPDGTAGLIVSNRFMTTRAGAAVRASLIHELNLRHVWDLGDTKLFDAAVLPAVLVGRGSRTSKVAPAFTTIYETTDAAEFATASPLKALQHSGVVALEDGRRFRSRHGVLGRSASDADMWRLSSDDVDAWLAIVRRNSAAMFGDIGKIKVGVKTCADKVFIKRDWSGDLDTRPELLKPLVTHHSARRFRSDPTGANWSILYPHESGPDGRRAIDIKRYPRSKAYLDLHRRELASRQYVTDAGRQWYEIWVPQSPAAWSKPKLVFRDISERPTFWVDPGGAVVNGDCYWMALHEKVDEDLLWLAAAIANSTFIESYYDYCFNNKLYAGRRRFMTQYVEQFPLPDFRSPDARALISKAKAIWERLESETTEELEQELDAAVWAIFGLSFKEVPR